MRPLNTVVIYAPTDPLSTLANTARFGGGSFYIILI